MMPAVNYEIYGCSSARRIPRVLQHWSLTLEENIIEVTSRVDRWKFEKAN